MDNLQVVNSSPGPKNIPIDVLVSLAEQGKNNQEIADIVGCGNSNISHRFKSFGYTKDRQKQIDSTKKTVYSLLQAKIINSIRSEEIEKSAFQTKIWSVGVLHDKISDLERKASGQVIEDAGMDGLSAQLARIAARSPVVINNILQVVGSLPEDVRDRISNLIPASLPAGHIIDGEVSR